MEDIEKHNKNYKRAKKRVEDEKGFHIHLVIYILINIAILFFRYRILVYINADTKDEDFFFWWRFGTIITPVSWGIGLFFHWLWAYKKTFLFNKKWEKKKIKKILEEEEEKKRF
ncbi:2TM domain-containing protein [Aquimarina gracilis]|uniref:2TM domain-containing protein n=2 Tax=Aquimarina gracilis TaxID=874422 RepID=A0ABU5ZWI7_9FLAO|nr:2TM domain-containing protein [Aquimarina gracilis]